MTTRTPMHGSYLVESGGFFSAAETRELTSWVNGLTVDQSAKANHVSPNTVKSHRAAILSKTGQECGIGVVQYCHYFRYIRPVTPPTFLIERRGAPYAYPQNREGARL